MALLVPIAFVAGLVTAGSPGWGLYTIKQGDTLSATGAPAKSGAPSMIANRMKLADGREIRS